MRRKNAGGSNQGFEETDPMQEVSCSQVKTEGQRKKRSYKVENFFSGHERSSGNVSAFKRNSVEKLASLTIIPIFHKNSKVVTNKFLNK